MDTDLPSVTQSSTSTSHSASPLSSDVICVVDASCCNSSSHTKESQCVISRAKRPLGALVDTRRRAREFKARVDKWFDENEVCFVAIYVVRYWWKY